MEKRIDNAQSSDAASEQFPVIIVDNLFPYTSLLLLYIYGRNLGHPLSYSVCSRQRKCMGDKHIIAILL